MQLEVNKFIFKTKSLIVVSIILFILLVLAMYFTVVNLESVNIATWIGTLGTLFGAFSGALIAGNISINNVKKQLAHDKRKRKRAIKNKKNSSARLIYIYFKSALDVFRNLEKDHKLDKGFTEFGIDYNLAHLKSLYQEIEKIDVQIFPDEEFDQIHACKLLIMYKINELENIKVNLRKMIRIKDRTEFEEAKSPTVFISEYFFEDIKEHLKEFEIVLEKMDNFIN